MNCLEQGQRWKLPSGRIVQVLGVNSVNAYCRYLHLGAIDCRSGEKHEGAVTVLADWLKRYGQRL